MSRQYRLIFESYDLFNESESVRTELMAGSIEIPIDLFTIGFSHEQQIEIIKSSQDALIKEQFRQRDIKDEYCPHCPDNILIRVGKSKSGYHDVFTDHKISMTRKQCPMCNQEIGSTVRKVFGNSMSADLTKIQAELGSDYSYRESEQLFTRFAHGKRDINNHDRIKQTSELIGEQLQILHDDEAQLVTIEPAAELIISVDGGHIKTTETDTRSFEAMVSIVYKPESLVNNGEDAHNRLTSKNCAGTTLNDNGQQIISNTIVAALKQGLTPHTKVTALCDGAINCWQVIDAFKPISASVTCILDWFHLSMRIHNISLPDDFKPELESIKWCLWHGKVKDALVKLNKLIWDCPEKCKSILEKLNTYISNNSDKIVNYDERKNAGLVYTSNLAEATVESLINQRCKGQKRMRWSREGLNPILQLRAAISSDDWNNNWKLAVSNAITKH